MSWLSLGPGQVAALWAVAGAAALWLYLRARQPVRRRVASLRFWASDDSKPHARRHLREPWAFLAQLLFLLLVILALADPRFGHAVESRSVVVIVDTSVWSQVQPPGELSWLDRERQEVTRVLAGLPVTDRVMLLRTDADTTAALPFTSDPAVLRRALAGLRPSSSVANILEAVERATAALSGSRLGLIVYVGPGMLDEAQAAQLDSVRASLARPDRQGARPQFLVRLVRGPAPLQNRGITGIALRRDAARPDQWHVLTRLKNYGQAAATLDLTLSIDDQVVGRRQVELGPHEATGVREDLVTAQSGLLEASIGPADWLAADDRAAVSIPAFHPVHVRVITARPAFAARLRGVLSADPYVQTEVVRPDAVPATPADVVVHDATEVPLRPGANTIWFVSGPTAAPPGGAVRVASWNAQHPVTRWVRTHDVNIRRLTPLQAQPDDAVLATGSGAEPLIVARERAGEKSLVVGFDPRDSNFTEQSAFPLLMAGAMEWMTQVVEDAAESLATGAVDLPGPVTRVVTPSKRTATLADDGRSVHLLALEAGLYRVVTPEGERSIPVNVPALPAFIWRPTPIELAAVTPEAAQVTHAELWRWLLALGILAVWVEWRLFLAAK